MEVVKAEAEAAAPFSQGSLGITNPECGSKRSGIMTTSLVVSCCRAVSRPLGPRFISRSVLVSVRPLDARAVTRRMSGGRRRGSFVVVFWWPGTRSKWLCLEAG